MGEKEGEEGKHRQKEEWKTGNAKLKRKDEKLESREKRKRETRKETVIPTIFSFS